MTAKALETPDLAHRGKRKGLRQEEARERARAGRRRQLPPAALGPSSRPEVPPRSWAFFARNPAADAARGGLLSPPSSVHLRFADKPGAPASFLGPCYKVSVLGNKLGRSQLVRGSRPWSLLRPTMVLAAAAPPVPGFQAASLG